MFPCEDRKGPIKYIPQQSKILLPRWNFVPSHVFCLFFLVSSLVTLCYICVNIAKCRRPPKSWLENFWNCFKGGKMSCVVRSMTLEEWYSGFQLQRRIVCIYRQSNACRGKVRPNGISLRHERISSSHSLLNSPARNQRLISLLFRHTKVVLWCSAQSR